MYLSSINILSRLNRKLLSQRWLDKLNLDRNTIDSHIKSAAFRDALDAMIEINDFSCSTTLSLSMELLKDVGKGAEPDNWLEYLYQYTLNKSFPEAVTIDLKREFDSQCEVYLRILKVICEFQKLSLDGTWQSKYAMNFLTQHEEEQLEHSGEYIKFLKAFKATYIYELMKLSSEVMGFNTLDHVCGVHYLALNLARQLKAIGIPVDLGRVSGAAAGHDIGKYGCKGAELKRVPYLHYYYTDQWFKSFNINYIRNIAINHSTWDLELENLSLESLLLIYSDFRVKNKRENGEDNMHIFSLKDSFDVILDKLDNVDEAKRKRYTRVYAKLKDFEDYLKSLAVDTELNNTSILPIAIDRTSYALMHGSDIVQSLKYISINHNINLMNQLRDEYSLDAILEAARSEKDWKNLREYIRILEEYSTYLTQNQKLQTIRFLYEKLIHPEDDIRRHCAELIGNLIAIYDEDYRKDLPEKAEADNNSTTGFHIFKEYMDLLLSPGHKIVPAHKAWIGYSIRIMTASLFASCRKAHITRYREILMTYYEGKFIRNGDTQLYLLETGKYIPLIPYSEDMEPFYDFVINMLEKHSSTLRLSALEATLRILEKLPPEDAFAVRLKNYFISSASKSKNASENLLKLKICNKLQLTQLERIYEDCCFLNDRLIAEVFLSNLKTATDWIKKKNQIELLLQYTLKNPKTNGLHSAIHFCNLLKVSAVETVRSNAGRAVLEIMPHLSLAERNEVAVELLRALEIEGHRFTEYIPRYLGQIMLFLQPKELDELIEDLAFKIKLAKSNIKSLLLKAIGVAISYYGEYSARFTETEEIYYERLKTMLGIILNGLGDYDVQAKQAAFGVLGKEIFGSKNIEITRKNYIFTLIAKKFLTLITDSKNEELLFLSSSAGLNHIYRFISDYTYYFGEIQLPEPEKIAFFPGTFDPFSLSHKAIAKQIKDLGFEVYLAVDEFSWSKKTLPNLLRRNIINMSIADEMNIFIYPVSNPVNISNQEDLMRLRKEFSHSKLFIVVGSDVILNASSYKNAPSECSIHSFNHIVFERGKNKKIHDIAKNINGEVYYLALSAKYSEISSTQIRNYIDANRDISVLIDPLAQQYIYDNGFYQREPQEKTSIKSLWLNLEIAENFSYDLAHEISHMVHHHKKQLSKAVTEIFQKTSGRIIVLRDGLNNNEIIGFSAFHWVRSSLLYEELKDVDITKYIREHTTGRIIQIDAMYVKNSEKNKAIEQILMTETLSFCVSKDYEFAIFRNMMDELFSPSIVELFKLHGFKEVHHDNKNHPVLVVDMSTPCVLNLDLENLLKEPFRSNLRIRQSIAQSRRKLQESLTQLYPGELLLSYETSMLHQSLIRKICNVNSVSTEITTPRKLGEFMCVPYGDILDRYVIPNTVTKALHTEKYFSADMKSFKIAEFPHYLDLKTQVKMLKSFKRPVILVDNILHKGYRMKALDPLFKEEGIKVEKIVTGILSGRGKDLMDMQNRQVDSVYFIPRLKIWFNENSLYPFIGGDALYRGSFPERNLLPSINLILPYTSPAFIRGASNASVYKLSSVCLENAFAVLQTIEEEYHLLHGRNLTLSNLGQVFTIPRCPDRGNDIDYDLNLSASHYIRNDMELLQRLESIVASANGKEV